MRYLLYIVTLPVCPVIHRVDFPIGACSMVGSFQNSVHHRVPHVHIRRIHIYFGTKRHASLFHFSVFHFFKKCQRLFHRSISIRRLYSWLGRIGSLLGNHFGRLLIYIGFTRFNHLHCPLIQLLKIIRSIHLFIPLEPEPRDIFLYRVHILLFLFFRIGIIKTEIHRGVILFSQTKINTDGFGMPNVQISVRFWRKTKSEL